MRQRGRLSEWNDDRGFGFVTSLDGESRAFVHVSAFPRESRRPQVLDLLDYEVGRDERGRLQASKVRYLAPVPSKHLSSSGSAPFEVPVGIPYGALALVLLAGLVFRGVLALGLAAGYLVVSAITFAAYAADKSAAQHGRFRTQESALHLLELIGGWPGGLLAQRLLRHKTVKPSFQAAFWVGVLANLVGLIVILSLAPPA